MSHPEGSGRMEMFLDSQLLEQARSIVAALRDSGESRIVIPNADNLPQAKAIFFLSSSPEALTVLTNIVVDGETYYVGVET